MCWPHCSRVWQTFVAFAGMDRRLGDQEGAKPADTGVEEDRGADSAFLQAWESPQHAGYVGTERAFVGLSSDTQMHTASVLQPAKARLDSEHATAPAYTSVEGATGHSLAAQVLQQAATIARPPAASSAAANTDGRGEFTSVEGATGHSLAAQVLQQAATIARPPAASSAAANTDGRGEFSLQAMDSTARAASIPAVVTATSCADGYDSRVVHDSATLMQLKQAGHELPSASAAACEGEHLQAACSAALLALSEQLKPPGSSSAYAGESSSEARGAASSAALLAPAIAVGSKEGAPAGSTRISTLLAPSKAQLKRARKAAAMQRSAQGTPQAGVQKRAWQDWLARRSGEGLAYCRAERSDDDRVRSCASSLVTGNRPIVRLAEFSCTHIRLAFGVSRVSMVHAHTWTVPDSPLRHSQKLCRCCNCNAMIHGYAVQKSKDEGRSETARSMLTRLLCTY